MPRKRDSVFSDPESVESFFREAGETKSSKEWKRQTENGPHPDQEILFEFAVGDLPESKRNELLEHTSHCLRCSEEIYSIRARTRKLGRLISDAQIRQQAKLNENDLASSRIDARLEAKTLELPEMHASRRILAIRVAHPASPDGRYWVPLLFEELKRGRARFYWPQKEGTQSGSQTSRSRRSVYGPARRDTPYHRDSLLRLHPNDILVYVSMPKRGQFTIVEITGPYRRSGVWDPESRKDARDYLSCIYHGTFDSKSNVVPNQLYEALRVRRSFWDLTEVKEHFAAFFSMISSRGSGPSGEA